MKSYNSPKKISFYNNDESRLAKKTEIALKTISELELTGKELKAYQKMLSSTSKEQARKKIMLSGAYDREGQLLPLFSES